MVGEADEHLGGAFNCGRRGVRGLKKEGSVGCCSQAGEGFYWGVDHGFREISDATGSDDVGPVQGEDDF